jgi:hypothetical protein
LPTTTTERTRAFITDPTEFSGAFIRASLEASRNWTTAYLDAIETAVDFQLEMAKSYGEQFANVTSTITDQAERAGAEATKVATRTVQQTAKTQAKTVQQTAKAQSEIVNGPTEEPIPGYDELNADEIVAKLPALSQRTLAKVGAYERAHDSRATVLNRVEALKGDEPTRGYDELTVADIQKLLTDGDEDLAKRVRDYERSHAARSGVLQAAERQLKQS